MGTINLIPLDYGNQHKLQVQALFLYDLLKERDPIANISHKSLPPFFKHLEFINSRPYAAWNIIERAAPGPEDLVWVPIGSVYLTQNDEIGIFLSEDHQGGGVGRKALSIFMEQNPRPKYLANIAPHNKASQYFFKALGFRCVQFTYQMEPECAV